jgi:hypothetical protein
MLWLQAKYWKQYVEAYIAANNDEATKQIFSRCLLNCLHINLWSDQFSPLEWKPNLNTNASS